MIIFATAMIILSALEYIELFTAAVLTVGVFVVTKSLTVREVKIQFYCFHWWQISLFSWRPAVLLI